MVLYFEGHLHQLLGLVVLLSLLSEEEGVAVLSVDSYLLQGYLGEYLCLMRV